MTKPKITWQEPLKELSDKLDEMKNDIKTINVKVIDLETSLEAVNVQTEVKENSAKVVQLDCALKALKAKYDTLYANFDQLQERLRHMECQSRRDNLLISGIPEAPSGSKESPNDCLEKVYDILQSKLNLPNARQMKITRCHRLGPPPVDSVPNRKPRSVIFKLHWFGDRQAIWRAKYHLKGSNMYLNEDFPWDIQQRRNVLIPIMRAAISKNYKAYILVDKLHLDLENGKHLVIDHKTLDKLPRDLDPNYITTSSDDNTMVFFNSLCPLSNFHESPFVFEGVKYDTVERYYQLSKANSAGNETLANRIVNAKTPAECKAHGDKVRFSKEGLTHWNQKKIQLMKAAVTAKFSQNTKAHQYLIKTGNKHLGEASPYDKFWGTGVGLRSNHATDQNRWSGQNKLGEMLMQLRNELT